MRVKRPRAQVLRMPRWPVLSTFILATITLTLIVLGGCGGKNGVIGSGGGASLTSIALTPLNPSLTLAQGATVPFDAIGNYSFGNPQDITGQLTWTSMDTTVATISSKGVATAVGSGRVVITGSIQDAQTLKIFQVSTVLTVVPQLTGITISPASAQIAKGTTQQFRAIGKYNDGTSPDITALVSWNSTQPGTAVVSSSPGTQGLASAAAAGAASITASIGRVSSPDSTLTVSNAKLASIAVTPQNPTFGLATAQPLVATGTFDDGSTQDLSRQVSWATSTNPSLVVRMSATGLATGVGLGNETITATFPASGAQNSTSVTVDESSVEAVNVLPFPMVMFYGTVSPVPFMANGTGQQMRAVAVLQDGSTQDVTHVKEMAWSSSDAGVASVDPVTGLMATTGPGSARIIASLGSKQGSTSLNVGNAQLESLVVAPNSATVVQGGIQNVVAVATFLAADNLTVFQQDVSEQASWNSDNAGVATVGDLLGLEKIAQGVGTGSANLSASLTVPGGGAASASAVLNVSPGALSSVSLAPANAAVPLDGGHQYAATGVFSDGTKQDLTLLANWSAANGAIATVSAVGYADASGPGQTGISATIGERTGSTPLLVNPGALARIDICAGTVSSPLTNCPPLDPFPPPPGISLANQTMFGLVAIGTFTDGSRQDLTDAVRWSSGSPGAGSVSNDSGVPGILTGVGRRGVVTGGITGGTAPITASAGGISSTVDVSATQATVQQLAIAPSDGVVALGTPLQCKVTAAFSDGSKQDVTQQVQWNSLNPDVAVVSAGGMAYPTGKGLANVSLDPSGLVVASNLISITVLNPSTTNVFPWPIGSVFQLHGLTVSSGDVSLLLNTPFTILAETDPKDSQHKQPCKPGASCTLWFATPALAPTNGTYTMTVGGSGQASALVTATMNMVVNSVATQVSGSTTLTVQ